MENLNKLDYSIFWKFYHLAGRSKIGDWVVIFLGEYLIYLVLLLVLIFLYQEWKKGDLILVYKYVIAGFAALVARYGVASFIRLFYHRPRPFIAFSLTHLIYDTTYSFPSGHTIFMFALAMAVYFFNKRLAWFLYASGAVIGLARVAGGVHYPSDILGGAVLGILVGFIVFKLLESWIISKLR